MENKKWIAKLLVVCLFWSVVGMPVSTPTNAVEAAKVTVTVNDGTGVKSIENTGGFRNDVTTDPILKGTDPRVDLSFTGTSDSNIADRYKLEYSFVNKPYTSSEITGSTNALWNEIPVTGTPNTDVLFNESGKLKRRSYDVTMLPNITNEATWENREVVYKYPFSSSEMVSADVIASGNNYGVYKDFIGYKETSGRRYDAKTVFSGQKITNYAINSYNVNNMTAVQLSPRVPDDTIVQQQKIDINGNVYKVVSSTSNTVKLEYLYGENAYKFDEATLYLTSDKKVRYLVRNNVLYVQTTSNGAKAVINNTLGNTLYQVSDSYIKLGNKWYTLSTSSNVYAKYQEATKFWGYYKAPRTGKFNLGLIADDGATGRIFVNGKEILFANRFNVQSSVFISENTPVDLVEGRYYPIFLEYFNWGGDAQFQMIQQYKATDSGSWGDRWETINTSNLYPSKSDSPGEYATTSFSGAGGLLFPKAVNDYYVIYKLTDKYNNTITLSGCYGPFTIPGMADFNLDKKAVKLDGKVLTEIGANQEFFIEYTIEPKSFPYTANYNNEKTLQLSQLKIQDEYTSLFVVTHSETGFVVNNNRSIEFTLDPITYTLDAVNKKYVPVLAGGSTKITKRVKVKLNSSPDLVQIPISVEGKSIMTYTEPKYDGNKSKSFSTGSINLMVLSSLKLSDKKGAQNIVSLERRPFDARLDFVLARTTKGNIQFDFDPLKVPVSAVRVEKIVVYKDGVKLNIKPTFVLVDGVNRLTLPTLEGKTGLEHGTYSIQFELDSLKMADLGKPLPYTYDWIIKGMHLYDPKVNNGLTDVGASTILEQIKVNIKVVKAPKIK